MNSKGKRSTIQNQKQRRITTTKLSQNKGITLIALVITIIVLLILAGVTIGALTGENGLITNAQLSNFATEMQEIKDNVQVKKNENAIEIATGKAKELFSEKLNENQITIKDTLKQEILFTRAGYPSNQQTSDYSVEDFTALVDEQGNVEDFYLIDKKTGNGKEKTYIYDQRSDVVFKISQTNIGEKVYHSYECASLKKGGSSAGGNQDLIIDKESEVIQVGDEYYYAPNMKGFNANETSLIYYSADFSKEKEIGVKEYIEQGEPYKIEENAETFTLHDYGQKIWANTKTTGNKLESWWVWIPRYAYKIKGEKENPTIEVIYIDLNNKPLHPKYNGTLPEGYEIHPGFTAGNKQLKGIWMSKYQPSYVEQTAVDGVLAPDMTGFDAENTYIELYDKATDNFTNEIKLADANLTNINQGKNWYDYENKIWANVKTNANGQEAWWVWIPRYAYRITDLTNYKDIDIIYVGLDNKPINKTEYPDGLPEGYEIHPGFTAENKQLKGIWMSKYEPSYMEQTAVEGVLAPDMTGFDAENTYIELYDKAIDNFTNEIKLADANLTNINQGKNWYDYENKIWANVKTNANGQEAWWVWIPRYAYRIRDLTNYKDIDIIYVGLDNKPINKTEYPDGLPEGYEIHPGFTAGNKQLKGIWMSKYEPSQQ